MTKSKEKKLDTAAELVANPGRAEEDILLDHEYDGIREYDNPLPRWWTLIFWGTFFFAIGYFFHYHLSGKGMTREQAFAEDMEEARAAEAKRMASEKVTEEKLAELVSTESAVSAGQGVFQTRCVACHADQGQGLVGPNLTDEYWIHGQGKLMDIFQVVSEGVAAKGMPAWRKQLSPVELRQVVAYVGTLRGKKVEGKAPEGEKVTSN